MGRTTTPLPGRPMPLHSVTETTTTSSTSRHTENGANSQRPNVLIPSVPGRCEDVLREHRNRLLQATSTENENVEPESANEISPNIEPIVKQFKQVQEQNRQILAAVQETQHTKDNSKTKITVSKAVAVSIEAMFNNVY
jgi:hypothetical protein